ncbi:MAG TPA: SCP2 sterol-binding domain-containing protein [Acidimicrobiales bacterium]|nr:SCP2 sterol-binding domain-containing protein [Acidimicrobiales bacterium]
MPNPFLSDAWLDDVKKIAEESGGGGMMPESAEINMVITGGPEGDKELHVTGGQFNKGLLDGAPTKLTLPYDVAKDMFINGNQQAAMQAFMSGKIKVEGDMTKLMAMQSGPQPDPAAAEALQKKILEVTSQD